MLEQNKRVGLASAHVSGDAQSAQFNTPHDVTVDGQGNIIVVDSYNNRIRMISMME